MKRKEKKKYLWLGPETQIHHFNVISTALVAYLLQFKVLEMTFKTFKHLYGLIG